MHIDLNLLLLLVTTMEDFAKLLIYLYLVVHPPLNVLLMQILIRPLLHPNLKTIFLLLYLIKISIKCIRHDVLRNLPILF